MPHKGKASAAEKLRIVEDYLSGKIGRSEASRVADVDVKTIRRWISRYKTEGTAGFLPQERNRSYSKETKLAAVLDYLSGKGSQQEICEKYRIRESYQLRDWLKVYNRHEEFKELSGGTHMTKNRKLVFETFDAAVVAEPDARPLFHSDRGYQYTSVVFHQKLQAAGMKQSMSRVAHCIDNGPMEGFWGILKRERYYGYKFTDRTQLMQMITGYIDFYNYHRLQRRLSIMTPMEFHQHFALAA